MPLGKRLVPPSGSELSRHTAECARRWTEYSEWFVLSQEATTSVTIVTDAFCRRSALLNATEGHLKMDFKGGEQARFVTGEAQRSDTLITFFSVWVYLQWPVSRYHCAVTGYPDWQQLLVQCSASVTNFIQKHHILYGTYLFIFFVFVHRELRVTYCSESV